MFSRFFRYWDNPSKSGRAHLWLVNRLWYVSIFSTICIVRLILISVQTVSSPIENHLTVTGPKMSHGRSGSSPTLQSIIHFKLSKSTWCIIHMHHYELVLFYVSTSMLILRGNCFRTHNALGNSGFRWNFVLDGSIVLFTYATGLKVIFVKYCQSDVRCSLGSFFYWFNYLWAKLSTFNSFSKHIPNFNSSWFVGTIHFLILCGDVKSFEKFR